MAVIIKTTKNPTAAPKIEANANVSNLKKQNI